jgi:hypothetical protein
MARPGQAQPRERRRHPSGAGGAGLAPARARFGRRLRRRGPPPGTRQPGAARGQRPRARGRRSPARPGLRGARLPAVQHGERQGRDRRLPHPRRHRPRHRARRADPDVGDADPGRHRRLHAFLDDLEAVPGDAIRDDPHIAEAPARTFAALRAWISARIANVRAQVAANGPPAPRRRRGPLPFSGLPRPAVVRPRWSGGGAVGRAAPTICGRGRCGGRPAGR